MNPAFGEAKSLLTKEGDSSACLCRPQRMASFVFTQPAELYAYQEEVLFLNDHSEITDL
jgi:hypothetical protein